MNDERLLALHNHLPYEGKRWWLVPEDMLKVMCAILCVGYEPHTLRVSPLAVLGLELLFCSWVRVDDGKKERLTL